MKILILQHIACETPGYIKDLMIKDNLNLTTIQLDEGEKIPQDLNEFDAMLCMGGPMDTWMEKDYPWLIEEKNKIKEFIIDLEKPFLGFCLGCQLLGEVLGGQVLKSNPSEIGVLHIHSQEDINIDPVFNFLPHTFKALQWHSYEVAGLENNKNVSVLGSSPTTKYQIFGYKKFAYGIQFHFEIRSTTVDDWATVPEYKNALEQSLGSEALPEMKNAVNAEISTMQGQCKLLYQNFLKILSN